MRLTHVRPSSADGLFLNEELVFYFDGPIEPTSVTTASVEILSEQGVPARGKLEVGADTVRFVPAPVLAADLADGGFQPGTRYTVTLGGFPRPEGLRSARGTLLERTRTWSFRTVDVAAPRASLLFEDRFQDRVGIVRIFPAASRQGAIVGSHDSIYLACDKPLDPSTVLPAAFSLLRDDRRGPQRLPVRVRVLENHPDAVQGPGPATARSSLAPQAWERERRACLIEVTPEEPLSAGTSLSGPPYFLRIDPLAEDAHPLLRDFSGNPVVADAPTEGWRISVDASGDPGRSEIREEFDSRRLRSAVGLPGYDGTAAWGESGRVTVRFPAAAGTGADGAVVLDGPEVRADVSATSIDLVEGSTCTLRSAPGLVVLRSQGRLSIRGRLAREVAWDPQTEIRRDPTLVEWSGLSELWVRDPAAAAGSKLPTLSAWLAAARAADFDFTVLVAGGDLVVAGEIACQNPLLLVAGGSVRVSGSIRGVQRVVHIEGEPGREPREATLGGVFLLRESGGGFDIAPAQSTAWLLLDEPQGVNPLAVPLRFAVLSAPVPARGDVLRWLPPIVGGGAPGRPSPGIVPWRVRYLPELAAAPVKPEDLASVDDPLLLDPPGPIQFLVELQVAPGGVWDPPWVDFVHLAWERPLESAPAPSGGR